MRRLTKPVLWRCLLWAAVVAAERCAAHLVAAEDVLAQLLVGRSPAALLALGTLYLLRLAVLFVLPGWILWFVLATARRRGGLRSSTSYGRRPEANRLSGSA